MIFLIERISTAQKRIIGIIGEATEYSIYGELELGRLKQLTEVYSLSFSDVQRALLTLLSDNLISEHFSRRNTKMYRLTTKGRQIYDAFRNQAGLIMSYENIGIETFITEGLESEIAFVESFDFLKTLDPNSEEKRYELGNGIYAVIESYSSKPLSEGRIEAHKKYLDIQMVLSGSEKIGWHKPQKAGINNKRLRTRPQMVRSFV